MLSLPLQILKWDLGRTRSWFHTFWLLRCIAWVGTAFPPGAQTLFQVVTEHLHLEPKKFCLISIEGLNCCANTEPFLLDWLRRCPNYSSHEDAVPGTRCRVSVSRRLCLWHLAKMNQIQSVLPLPSEPLNSWNPSVGPQPLFSSSQSRPKNPNLTSWYSKWM